MNLILASKMTMDWEVLGKYGGIFGITIGLIFTLFQQIIKSGSNGRPINNTQSKLITTILFMAYSFGILSFILYAYLSIHPHKYTIQYRANFKDQYNNPCKNILTRITSRDKKKILCDTTRTDGSGFVIFEKKDTTVSFINALISFWGNDSLEETSKNIELKSPESLNNDPDLIVINNKAKRKITFSFTYSNSNIENTLIQEIEKDPNYKHTNIGSKYSITFNNSGNLKNDIQHADLFKYDGGVLIIQINKIQIPINECVIPFIDFNSEDSIKGAIRGKIDHFIESHIELISNQIKTHLV